MAAKRGNLNKDGALCTTKMCLSATSVSKTKRKIEFITAIEINNEESKECLTVKGHPKEVT